VSHEQARVEELEASRSKTSSELVVGPAYAPEEATADRLANRALARIGTTSIPSAPDGGRIRRATDRRVARRMPLDLPTGDGDRSRDEPGVDADDEGGSLDPDIDLDGEPGIDAIGSSSPVAQRVRRSSVAAAPLAHGAEGGPVDDVVGRRIQRSRGSGDRLDGDTRDRMESGFGADFGAVRIHRGSDAAQLNRSLSAHAFAVGSDVYFGAGKYQPSTSAGERLLAHELAHVVAESGSTARRVHRNSVIRRRFEPATTNSKAHLRADGKWGTFRGKAIAAGTQLFVDDAAANQRVQVRRNKPSVTWVPAVNVPPDHAGAVAPKRVGYIRSTRTAAGPSDVDTMQRDRIRTILEAATGDATLRPLLTKPAHIDFLLRKSIGLDQWNPASPTLSGFSSGLESLESKLHRLVEGADHVARSLEHWRNWLHPGATFHDLTFKESDLHEHGLGVMKVAFKKPLGGAAMFTTDTDVEVMIKPEDKSLEEALLGAQSSSLASKMNAAAGLAPHEAIGTLKMRSMNIAPDGATEMWSTLVEKVKGTSSEDLVGGDGNLKSEGTMATGRSFHETLIFAFLAGIEDLHWENVMWIGDTPYLIDADTALARHQLEKNEGGDVAQNGFSTYNKAETAKSIDAVKNNDNSVVQSKIFDIMLNNPVKRAQLIAAITTAFRGKKGRTVPIFTKYWTTKKNIDYPQHKALGGTAFSGWLDAYSSSRFLVDVFGEFKHDRGPGLRGAVGPPVGAYNHAEARIQLEHDMEANVVPFFTYEYDTGKVYWNGKHIYTGQTIDAAMITLAARFA
jgi:hypothetical protein